ncbi:MAG: metalloprotease [Halobacteria archaeon]
MSVGLKTSSSEVKQIFLAWMGLTAGFTLLLGDPVRRSVPLITLGTVFITSLVTAGLGFLLHELGHKVVAQRYGYWAEFRADYEMLAITVVSGAVGFLFAAPGAVMIQGRTAISARESGIISVAGPLVNLALFGIFAVIKFFGITSGGVMGSVLEFGLFINAFLAAFNMVPFGPLDGRKVIKWSKPVFVVVFGVGLALTGYVMFLQ